MPKPKGGNRWATSGYIHDDTPLAVPLDVAAQLLARPLHELERAGVEPYITSDGRKLWSLYGLAKALGMVEKRPGKYGAGRGRIVVERPRRAS